MKELSPIEQAEQEIGLMPYERIKPICLLAVIIPTAVALLQIMPRSNIAYIIGGIIYTSAALLDNISTIESLNAHNDAKKIGIEDDVIELNPFLKNIETSQVFLKSKKHWTIESVSAAIALSIPAAGIALGIGKGIVGLNNLRLAKRSRRAIEIAQTNRQ